MPSLTPLQKAAFDAIDTLHFGQVVMHHIYKSPLKVWYPHILDRLNEILQKAGVIGKQAEITKHYILAALEIFLSVDEKYISDVYEFCEKHNTEDETIDRDTYKKVSDKKRDFSIIMLIILAEKNGVDKELFSQIVNDVMDDKALDLSSMPYPVCCRLTEGCYAFEYPDAPLGFYRELVSCDIIKCGKYSHNIDKYAKKPNSELSSLFIRAGLLFELRILQRSLQSMILIEKEQKIDIQNFDLKMLRIDRKNLADYYKRLIDVNLLGENSNTFITFKCKEHVSKKGAEDLLKSMSKLYFHKRMFGGTQASWLGTLGAFDIEASRCKEPDKAIYYEIDNSFTISEKIELKFLDYGFSVAARSLYLRHKKIRKKGYPKINYYYHLLWQKLRSPWYLTGDFYDDLALKYKEDKNE